ncbi:hypothetical protein VP01_8612g1 [Puccinia sorghi]|uniref:Retrotransposon gag domain-containing protein n=1 Tax=Puccinia sorghi TaxID=27349 RepID=A0A0L6U9L4_9BASI|nr:hypothetical protein VP01_8612g1 [Puccinia sorghi]
MGPTAQPMAEFITSFNGYFLEPERKGKAQQALCTFKQSGNMDSYTQQFNVHTYNSTWSDNILVSLYHGGLKENRLTIVSSGKAFPTLPDIQALAMQLSQLQPHFQNQPTNPFRYHNQPKCNGPLGNERPPVRL